MTAAKAQIVELEQRQIRLLAGQQLTEIAAPEQPGRASGRPLQHLARSNALGAVAQPLQIERLTGLLHQVRGIVGGRAIHPEPHRRTGRLQIQGRADAGGEPHIGDRTVAHPGARRPQPRNLVRIEVDAVRQPGAIAKPAHLLQIIDGTQAKARKAERLLIQRLRQMGVQPHIELGRESGALHHDLLGHREGGAWGQRNLDLRPGAALVVLAHQPQAVIEDLLLPLHRVARRQAPLIFAKAHGATGQHGAHPQLTHRRHLNIDGLLHPAREEVVVIRGHGAAREQQLRHRHLARQRQRIRRQSGPHRIEGLEPGEERLIDHRPPGAGQGLVEVVVGIDKARQHHMVAGIEQLIARPGRLLACRQHLAYQAVFNHQPAAAIDRFGGKGGKGVFDPDTGSGHGRLLHQ